MHRSCHDAYESVLTSVQCLPGVCHGPRLLALPVQPLLPPPHRPGWCWLLLPDKSGSGQRQPYRDLQPLHWSGLFPAILHVRNIYPLYSGLHFTIVSDQCAYTRDGNPNAGELYCFRTQGATHSTTCSEYPTSVSSGVTGSGATGSGCPYTKDNVSWGEYQVTIPMPSGTGAAYFSVILEFDADTTIVSRSLFSSLPS